MCDIYLIRHGFTPANNASYNGQTHLREIAEDKDMPLEIKYGKEQANEIGDFLNCINGHVLVLSSPYRRVKETIATKTFDKTVKNLKHFQPSFPNHVSSLITSVLKLYHMA